MKTRPKGKIHISPTHILERFSRYYNSLMHDTKGFHKTRLYLVTGWGKGPREAEKGQSQVDEAILIGLKVLVCVCAHTHTRLLLPIPRLRPSPLTMPEHPSCITHEPVSKQSSRSKGNSINKPSAGSLALIGCPCLPPC